MTASDLATVFVGAITLGSAIFSGRAARSAAKYNADSSTMNSRTVAETEAYNRARKMDIETIERQDKEIDEIRKNSNVLREKVRSLMRDNERLHQENETLRQRVSILEQTVGETSG